MTFLQLCYYHSYLGQFMMSPSAEAYEYLLHIIGYIIGNASTGISFGGALQILPTGQMSKARPTATDCCSA
eukprot:scaffold53336_cov100-Phaeocystis_antarctica.AAC.2